MSSEHTIHGDSVGQLSQKLPEHHLKGSLGNVVTCPFMPGEGQPPCPSLVTPLYIWTCETAFYWIGSLVPLAQYYLHWVVSAVLQYKVRGVIFLSLSWRSCQRLNLGTFHLQNRCFDTKLPYLSSFLQSSTVLHCDLGPCFLSLWFCAATAFCVFWYPDSIQVWSRA